MSLLQLDMVRVTLGVAQPGYLGLKGVEPSHDRRHHDAHPGVGIRTATRWLFGVNPGKAPPFAILVPDSPYSPGPILGFRAHIPHSLRIPDHYGIV